MRQPSFFPGLVGAAVRLHALEPRGDRGDDLRLVATNDAEVGAYATEARALRVLLREAAVAPGVREGAQLTLDLVHVLAHDGAVRAEHGSQPLRDVVHLLGVPTCGVDRVAVAKVKSEEVLVELRELRVEMLA